MKSSDDNVEDQFTNFMNEESDDKSNLSVSIANKSIWSSDVDAKSSYSEFRKSLEDINHEVSSFSSLERQKGETHQTIRKIHSKGKLDPESSQLLDTALFEESDSLSGSLMKSTENLSAFNQPANITSSERMIGFSSVEVFNSGGMKDEHASNAGVQFTTEADIGVGRNNVVGLYYKSADPRLQPGIISDTTNQAGIETKQSIKPAGHDTLKQSSKVVSYSSVETGSSMDTFFTHLNVSNIDKLRKTAVHSTKEPIPISEHHRLKQFPKIVTYFSKETEPMIDTFARNSDVSSLNKYINTVARSTNEWNPLAEHHTLKQSPEFVTYSSKETEPRMETFVANLNVSNLNKHPKFVANVAQEWMPLPEHNMLKQSPEVVTYSSEEALPQKETLVTMADISNLTIDPKLQASSSAELISEPKESLAIKSPGITLHADKGVVPKARSVFTKNDHRNRGMPPLSLGYPSKKPIHSHHLSKSKEMGDMKEELIFEQQIGKKNPDVISLQQIHATKDDPGLGSKTSESAENLGGDGIELLIQNAYKSPDILTFTSKNSSNDRLLRGLIL